MLAEDFIRLTRCLHTGTPLRSIGEEQKQLLNQAIQSGRVCNAMGERVQRTVDGALIDATNQFIYPIHDSIPVLVRDEAFQNDGVLTLDNTCTIQDEEVQA